MAVLLRIVVNHHTTFFINSAAHMLGSRPYSEGTSARDSWILAPLTYGEGYHNFHHRFQIDYRNGVRWYHFDPTKWWIWAAARVGLVVAFDELAQRAVLDAAALDARERPRRLDAVVAHVPVAARVQRQPAVAVRHVGPLLQCGLDHRIHRRLSCNRRAVQRRARIQAITASGKVRTWPGKRPPGNPT